MNAVKVVKFVQALENLSPNYECNESPQQNLCPNLKQVTNWYKRGIKPSE